MCRAFVETELLVCGPLIFTGHQNFYYLGSTQNISRKNMLIGSKIFNKNIALLQSYIYIVFTSTFIINICFHLHHMKH